MTIRSLLLVSTLAWLAWGCTPRAESESAPEPILNYHFIGASRVSASPDGTRLREVAAMPQSQALLKSILDRLAGSSGAWAGGRISSNAAQAATPILRSFLTDLWERESALLVQRTAAQPLDWSLAVELGPERLGVWRTNLLTLAQAWNLGAVRQGIAGDLPTIEIVSSNAPIRLRWVEAGPWGLLGVGTPSLPGLAASLKNQQLNQRPVAVLTNGWLECSANLTQWAQPLGLAPGKPWPRVEMNVRGDGEHVRTAGRLIFPQAVTGPLEAWATPTNIITEPLIAFAAARGVGPLLELFELPGRLGLKPDPQQLFTWAQGSAEGQVYCSFPQPGLTNILPKLATTLPQLFPEWARAMQLTNILYLPTNQSVVWRGILPVVEPTLRAVRVLDRDYAVIGLFPSLAAGPPPADLLDQLSRPDLLYYSWEVTQPRIHQWTMLTQLLSAMAQSPQLSTNHAGLPWLLKVGPSLGNTATEILAPSPHEWTFSRRSHVGFTAAELVWAARWIEGASFPRPALLLGQPGASRRAQRPTPR